MAFITQSTFNVNIILNA